MFFLGGWGGGRGFTLSTGQLVNGITVRYTTVHTGTRDSSCNTHPKKIIKNKSKIKFSLFSKLVTAGYYNNMVVIFTVIYG